MIPAILHALVIAWSPPAVRSVEAELLWGADAALRRVERAVVILSDLETRLSEYYAAAEVKWGGIADLIRVVRDKVDEGRIQRARLRAFVAALYRDVEVKW